MKKRIGIFSAVLCTVIMLLASCGSRFEDYRILTTLSNNTDWGTVTTTGLNGSGGASPNSKIVITAVPKTGYYADHCTCSEIPDLKIVKTDTENVWEFTMPDKDITVTVYFKAIEVEPEAPKLVITDGKSTSGVKLSFTNIPEDAVRRYIYLGEGVDKTLIDEKAEWADPDHVKDETFFYPFTKNGKEYVFTVVYYDTEKSLAEAKETITAKGGIGDIEYINREKVKISVDKKGNLTYDKKPVINEEIVADKMIAYSIQGWDSVSDWTDAGTAWLTDEEGYYYCDKYDFKLAGYDVEYNGFNVIDYICSRYSEEDPEKNKTFIDSLVKNKGIVLDVHLWVKSSLDDEWYKLQIYNSEFFEKGTSGKGVYVLEPSPLLGTWMGKSKAYTFDQNKVIVEDAISKNEYSYSYTANTVTFNGETFEYEIDAGRTKLSITEDDDSIKKYNRTDFGKVLEAGYETAEVKIENNKLKFVTTPGAKTVPEGVTSYRIDLRTENEEGKVEQWLNGIKVDSLTFNEINLDDYLWDKEIKNKKINAIVLWGQDGWNVMCDSGVVTNYEVADSWKKAEVKVENNVLKFVRNPGANTIPEGITSYRVDICTEPVGEDTYGWISRVFEIPVGSYNDICIDDYVWDKTLRNNKVKLYLLWGTDSGNQMCNPVEISNYSICSGYELPVTTIEGTVVSMTKPGNKLLALYPETDHYTVFIHKEANKYENWLAYKEFALSEDITFDLYEMNINPDSITNGKVNICLELKKSDENMLKRLTDNNWVDFDGYKYHFTLSDNVIGMNDGISFRISEVPEEAKIRDVGVRIDGNWYEINWSETVTEVQSTTFTYPLVVPNTEYEVGVNYYIKDAGGFQSTKIATSSFKTTPTGGSGSIIAVNAPSISGKIEGQNFIWVTKPTIVGTHTKGTLNINFFNPANGHFIGGYGKKYSELIDSSYTGFDLADAYWNDEGKSLIINMSALNVIYQYDANDESGDYAGLPCTVNQKSQNFIDLSISIDLTSGE